VMSWSSLAYSARNAIRFARASGDRIGVVIGFSVGW
jgi:hypothetical protein